MRFSTMKKVRGEMRSISRATFSKWTAVKVHNIIRFYVFLSFFWTFTHKVAQLGLFCMKLGTQHYLIYIIVLKWLELKIEVIC